MDEEGEYSKYDMIMEEKLKYGDLQEESFDEDEGNDETFGQDNAEILKDFDFSAGDSFFGTTNGKPVQQVPPMPSVQRQPQRSQPQGFFNSPPNNQPNNQQYQQLTPEQHQQFLLLQQRLMQHPPQQSIGQHFTVAEIEARMIQNSRANTQLQAVPQAAMSMQEVEAALFAQQQQLYLAQRAQHEMQLNQQQGRQNIERTQTQQQQLQNFQQHDQQQRQVEQKQQQQARGINAGPNDFPALGANVINNQRNQQSQQQHSRSRTSSGNRNQQQEDFGPFFRGRDGPRQQNSHNQQQPHNYQKFTRRNQQVMSQYEKEFIAKIQISHLVTDDPYVDDFYFKIYTSFHNKPTDETSGNDEGLNWQQNFLKKGDRGGRNITSTMQQQMQKLIENRKQTRPKGTVLYLEGSLGKISLNSNKAPKQVLEIKLPDHSVPAVPSENAASDTLFSQKKVLKSIEKVYGNILTLEHLQRKIKGVDGINEKELMENDGEEGVRVKWAHEFDENLMAIFTELKFNETIPYHVPHPLNHILHYNKGKTLIPRIFQFLTPPQKQKFIHTLLSRYEGLEVLHIRVGIDSPAVDVFMGTVINLLVGNISELGFDGVNLLMRLLLERHNLTWLCGSRVGLATLTMLLSRAEILKGEGGGDLGVWTQMYNYLFNSLQTQFSQLFPGKESTKDDVYIWQFLSAIAVGATSPEHQKILVTEVREKILETSRSDDPKALANVNLFLTALGLGVDAKQLASITI